ncbi:MAG: protein tyrosine phosphatase [Bacteroidales bacterium]|nr:MAG: protein tyrosine phosphatase [Bacteroidales bacterium]
MKSKIALSVIFFIISVGFKPVAGQTSQRPSSWGVKINSQSLKNLYRVSDDLYRSEQPDREAFVELSALGIKSSLNLRTTETDDELIGKCDIKPFLAPMDAGSFTDKEMIAALKVIKNAPKPILVHCRHGSDRTGVVVAMYRIIFQGWTREDALNELLNGGYGFHTNYKNIPEYIKTANIEAIRKGIK